MKNIFLIACLFLVACEKPPYQEPELKQMANKVLYEGAKRGKYYSVDWIGFKYANLGGGTVGLCRKSSSKRTIYVDHSFWLYKEEYREQLIAHELGHCLLDKGHDDSVMYQVIPKTLMHTYVINASVYKYYRTYYFDQLFN